MSKRPYLIRMKNGDLVEARVDRIEPIGSLGLSLIVDGVSVGGYAFGQFTEWHEFREEDGRERYAVRLEGENPSIDADKAVPKGGRIRRLGGNSNDAAYSQELRNVLYLLCDHMKWESIKEMRADYHAEFGGFQPVAYKAFRKGIEEGKSAGVLETEGEY